MNTVKISGKTVRLRNRDVIGVGGEATVFKHGGQAVKVYLQPDAARARKLQAMVPRARTLPPGVVAPQQLVTDGGQIVGFTMPLLDATYTELRQLSVKKYRAKAGLTSRDIVRLFLNMWRTLDCIHRAGMVVGDLNDLNVMFRGDEVAFIDADSFQFDNHPCRVGSEAYIDPALYGKDLTQAAFFQPEHDWYAFAVLLFKSLLLTHPYGGVHPSVKLMTHRAQQRISVFDSSVTYPRIAHAPDLLTDDLAHTFAEWFTDGRRGVFPENVLRDYTATVKNCPHCGATYPVNRAHCPMCAAAVPVTVPAQVSVKTLLHTGGDIIAWRLAGDELRALSHEGGKVVLYTVDRYQQTRRTELFNAMPDAQYRFLDDMLVVSPARDSDTLMIVDVSGDTPAPVQQTTTAPFSGTQPVFDTSARHLYRLAGGYLMRGRVEYGQLVEQSVMAISEGQTWFTAALDDERVFGYFRTFNEYQHWLLLDKAHVEADVSALEPGEFLTDIDVVFAKESVLVVRQTQLNGVERVRLDEIDTKGRQLHAEIIPRAADFGAVRGHAYMGHTLLRATDAGIVQSRLDTGAEKTFAQTEPVVQRGDALMPYRKGLLAVLDRRAVYVTV